MPEYHVTETIQSLDLTNPPALVHMYRGWELHKAMSALVSAAAGTKQDDDSNLPESMRYKVTSVTMVVSECVWETNQYQPWARVPCDGRVEETTREGQTGLLCHAHRHAWDGIGRTYVDTTAVPVKARNCRVCGYPLNSEGYCTMPKHDGADHCPMNEVQQ